MFFLVLIALLAFALYFLGVKPYKYWEVRGIPYVKPYPLVGNIGQTLLRRKHFSELLQEFYYLYPKERLVGFYQFSSPALMVRDPELIKQITVKEFDTFPEHRSIVPDDVDPLWSKNLVSVTGERWHDLRSTLSPSFTSSKMRMMFELMKDCAKQFVEHFEKKEGLVEVEMKDSFTRYANDVIATTIFGITCNSLENRDNEFYLMGKRATDFTGVNGLKFFFSAISPNLMKLFKIGIFSDSVSNFFRGIISETLRVREEKNIVRPDMINLLMQARKGHLKHESSEPSDDGFAVVQESGSVKQQKRHQKQEISDEDITAQALIFFLAGFDTASTFMCFTVYELAINPDVQDRLYREVKDIVDSGKREVTYQALLGMKYLDMVVTECLRKWPPQIVSDRVCIRPYTIDPKPPGKTPVTLETGTNVWIPIFPIHRDPKYYPNPEKFDPERFSDENKDTIVPYTYLPFGAGPRNCIGSRFALLEGKLIVFEILKRFEIVPVERTQIPLKLQKNSFNPMAEKGFWLGLKPRESGQQRETRRVQ